MNGFVTKSGRYTTNKVAVITDSICCLTKELIDRYNIEIVPINFFAGGNLYKDGVDITPSKAYKLFLDDPESFKTSAASPEDCLKAYRNVSQRAENILFCTVSNKLSMMYSAACTAKEMAKNELPETNIEVMDTYQATPSEGMVALAAARAIVDGKDLPEVIRTAEEVRDKVSAVIFLDTIRHVYRSGRIPKVASQIGSVLNIKPILTVSSLVHFAGMARNRKQGIERVLQMMRDRVGDKPVHAAVTHAYAPDEAEKLRKRVADDFNCIELWLSEFSPVMGYACGTGTVGVAFYPED
ncbi:MAG: DegV family protein [Dehalococcoidales bacterium]|nr:DegV family protein [Dehalococcoidales bacterium]